MRRLAAVAAVLTAAALVATACAPGTVRVAFRPSPGSRYTYRVEVDTVSVLSVDGERPRQAKRSLVLQVDQTVLESGPDGSRLQVVLRPESGGDEQEPQTVLVRLDRAAQLVGVDGPPGALGDLGVPEIFPAAAGAPPDRPLRPGERWKLDAPVSLPESAPERLRGEGRLDRLTIVDDRKAATVATVYELPVVRRTEAAPGQEAVIEGVQTTRSEVTHALSDGAVERSEATTTAVYAVRFLPPPGVEAEPVRGSLSIEVRSTTDRT